MDDQIIFFENEAKTFLNFAVENDKNNKYEAAIFYYSEAVQSILNAVKLGSQNSVLKERAIAYLKRGEDLKNKEKERIEANPNDVFMSETSKDKSRAFYMLSEAMKEDEEGNMKEALKLYQESLSLLMEISNSCTNDREKNEIRNSVKNALERAETLKAQLTTSGNDRPSIVSQRQQGPGFTAKEISVLKSTSTINMRQYLPFIDAIDYKERFSFTIPFSDKDGLLALSEKQNSSLKKWIRPSEFLEEPKMIMVVSCFSIQQTIVTDCSFVASIAVAAQYERRFQTKLITNIIYPQDRMQQCVYNPCGKYMVKLNINGVPRKIIIDDFLPMGRNNKLLCSFSSNRSELWVSLLEKAYMKIMGGYDFPGSNSNIDLHALTGWIPERIPLIRNDPVKFKADKEFKKLYDHFHKGNCLVTVATGTLSDAEADRAGLVATHAYAMLDIREINNNRLFLLKNPWSHLRWKGKFSDNDTNNWTPSLQKALNFDLSTAQTVDNGVFWIDYDSLQHFFDVIYVNWNPKLFPFTTCVHDQWIAAEGPKKDIFNISQNPQYRLKLQNPRTEASLWILLTRHITDKDDFANNREFIALMVYNGIDSNKSKIFYPNDPPPIIDGIRINTPHYLVKKIHDPSKNESNEYILVVTQYEKNNSICFTLRVYSSCPISLVKLTDPYKHYKTIEGKWAGWTAGGCQNNRETYYNNPIYQMKLSNNFVDNRIMIELKAPRDFPIGFELEAIDQYNTTNPNNFTKKSSGDYRRGFVVMETSNMSGGIYNIRVSTYSPNQEGPFILKIGSFRDLTLCQLNLTK